MVQCVICFTRPQLPQYSNHIKIQERESIVEKLSLGTYLKKIPHNKIFEY